MANVKTITATTAESTVEFNATYQFMWFRNFGENDCYICAHSGIVANADGVTLLKAGEVARLTLPQSPAQSTAYIKAADGSNTVEVHAQNYSDCPFKRQGKGGEQITVESLTATENKIYTAPTGKAYSPVTVNVPNSYSAGDEGKVVSNGALVSQTSDTKTQNGIYDTTFNNQIVVNVASGLDYIEQVDYLETSSNSALVGFTMNSLQANDEIHIDITPLRSVSEQCIICTDYGEIYLNSLAPAVYGNELQFTQDMDMSNVTIGEHRVFKGVLLSSEKVWLFYYFRDNYPLYAYINSIKVFRGGVEVINMVPAKYHLSNYGFLYDTINHEVYRSTTGTDFIPHTSE